MDHPDLTVSALWESLLVYKGLKMLITPSIVICFVDFYSTLDKLLSTCFIDECFPGFDIVSIHIYLVFKLI